MPLVCYLVVKEVSEDAVPMPGHYIYDTVQTKEVRGKVVADTVWHRVPDVPLTNQLGKTVSMKDVSDRIVVASFFFTRCPTICPKLTQNIKLLQDNMKTSAKVGNRFADYVQYMSFSVDPERDSVQHLKQWANRFQINPDNWWLLTGDKKKIYDLSINEMKVGLVDGKGVDTSFFHTDYLVLLDRNRNIRGYYHGLDSTQVEKLAKDIVYLYLEKDPKRKSAFAGKFELMAIVALITISGLALFVFLLKQKKK